MLKYDIIVFISTLFDILGGRCLWKRMIKKNDVDLKFDFVILLLKGDSRCNYYMLLYLNKFIEQLEKRKNHLSKKDVPIIRKNENFFIITNDSDVENSALQICRRISKVIKMSEMDINKILCYYKIYPFTDRLFIGLFDGITGRSGYSALKAIGFTTEELVANGIYDFKIKKFNRHTRVKVPRIRIRSQAIKDFIITNDLRFEDTS